MMEYTEKDIYQTKEDYLNKEECHIVIADIDETIVNISPKAYRLLIENKEFFNKYLDLDTEYTEEEVLNRPIFGLEKWLVREEYKDNLPEEVLKEFYALFDDPEFYDDLPLTPLGESLKAVGELNTCKRIYIISHCVGDLQFASKTKLLQREYSKIPKFTFIPVELSKKKSDVIKENEIRWTTFMDDNIDVVCDVIENTVSFGQEVMIPKLGYNEPTYKLSQLVETFNINLSYVNYTE